VLPAFLAVAFVPVKPIHLHIYTHITLHNCIDICQP
jgi:hypothetical protein